MIYVIAELRAEAGHGRQGHRRGAQACVAGTVKEDGCLSYDIHRSVTDPDAPGCWSSAGRRPRRSSATFDTPHFKAWRAAGTEFVVERKVEVVTPDKIDTDVRHRCSA